MGKKLQEKLDAGFGSNEGIEYSARVYVLEFLIFLLN
jgi:hypothetical protein